MNFYTIDTSIKIFQPIYKAYINAIDCNEEYIKKNSFNHKKGLGNIFSEKDHIVCHRKNIKLSPSSEFGGKALINLLSVQTFKTLRFLWDENISSKFENKSTKQKVLNYYHLATETISEYLKKINRFNQ